MAMPRRASVWMARMIWLAFGCCLFVAQGYLDSLSHPNVFDRILARVGFAMVMPWKATVWMARMIWLTLAGFVGICLFVAVECANILHYPGPEFNEMNYYVDVVT